MDPNQIAAIVALLESTGFVGVSCRKNFDPPVVVVDLPAGLALSFSYPLYEQVRVAAGLPDGVCD